MGWLGETSTQAVQSAYGAVAPTIADMLLGPMMPTIKARTGETAKALYAEMLPEFEAQVQETAYETLKLIGLAAAVGVGTWFVLRKKRK